MTETDVEGVPTTIPAHLAVLSHPDFVSVRHSTTWLSQSVDLSGITRPPSAQPEVTSLKRAQDVEVEVDGRRYEVSVWLPHGWRPTHPGRLRRLHQSEAVGPRQSTRPPGAGATGGQVTVPMQGTVVKVLVKPGDKVEAGQAVCVLEAMKMENNIVSQFAARSPRSGSRPASPVGTGDVIVVLGAAPA